MIIRQADDLPAHAFTVMQQTLDICAETFPGVQRSDLQRAFVDSYFNPPDSIMQKEARFER